MLKLSTLGLWETKNASAADFIFRVTQDQHIEKSYLLGANVTICRFAHRGTKAVEVAKWAVSAVTSLAAIQASWRKAYE
jgi:hypothetical protein